LEVNLRDAESRLRDAESRLCDLEKQSHDLTLEKSRLLDRIDSLEAGNERFFEMKEKQVWGLSSNKLVCFNYSKKCFLLMRMVYLGAEPKILQMFIRLRQ